MKKVIYLLILNIFNLPFCTNAFAVTEDDCNGLAQSECDETAGCYYENNTCDTCPNGYYCPGGNRKEKCTQPHHCDSGSATHRSFTCYKQAGFYRNLLTFECEECPQGYYCPQNETIAHKCDAGTTTNGKRAKTSSDCNASYLACAPDNSEGCYYKEETIDCEEYCANAPDCSDTGGKCVLITCDQYNQAQCGTQDDCQWSGSGCRSVCQGLSAAACRSDYCTTNNIFGICAPITNCRPSSTCGVTAANGYWHPCGDGYYCNGVSSLDDNMSACGHKCPDKTTSGARANDFSDCIPDCANLLIEDCASVKGCYKNNNKCEYCPEGYYCGGGQKKECPLGSTSLMGAIHQKECFITGIKDNANRKTFDDPIYYRLSTQEAMYEPVLKPERLEKQVSCVVPPELK